MGNNKRINQARAVKNDEFFTCYDAIADELKWYRDQLLGTNVHCPCDFWKESSNNPKHRSNFVRYFRIHAGELKLKNFSYSGFDPQANDSENRRRLIRKFQNLDYSKYDIIITNPPFSKIREFFKYLIAAKVKFLIIGSINAIKYKDLFPLLKNNQMKLGFKRINKFIGQNGELISSPGVWFTNLNIPNKPLCALTAKYSPEKYPKYNNSSIINIDRAKNIPFDYEGLMGVPISFLVKLNEKQFKIIDLARNIIKGTLKIGNKHIYERVVIRKILKDSQ